MVETIKVGDDIVVKHRWNSSIQKIERETKTMFITDRTRIYKKDNCIVGDGYNKVVKATQHHYDMFEKSKLAHELNEFDFNKLKLGTLRNLAKVTGIHTTEKEIG